jgi:uncharacterized coiled-coil protein SlyX
MHADDANAQPPENRLHERLIELEMLFTHLQRTLADLDQVVLSQQKQIEALERTIGSLHGDFDRLASSTHTPRTPEEEKPPHY